MKVVTKWIGGLGLIGGGVAFLANSKTLLSSAATPPPPVVNTGSAVLGGNAVVNGNVSVTTTIQPPAPAAVPALQALPWKRTGERIEIPIHNAGTAPTDLLELSLELPSPVRVRLANTVRGKDPHFVREYRKVAKVVRRPTKDDLPQNDPFYADAFLGDLILSNSGDAISNRLPRPIGPGSTVFIYIDTQDSTLVMLWNERLNEYEASFDLARDLSRDGAMRIVASFSSAPDVIVEIPVTAILEGR